MKENELFITGTIKKIGPIEDRSGKRSMTILLEDTGISGRYQVDVPVEITIKYIGKQS